MCQQVNVVNHEMGSRSVKQYTNKWQQKVCKNKSSVHRMQTQMLHTTQGSCLRSSRLYVTHRMLQLYRWPCNWITWCVYAQCCCRWEIFHRHFSQSHRIPLLCLPFLTCWKLLKGALSSCSPDVILSCCLCLISMAWLHTNVCGMTAYANTISANTSDFSRCRQAGTTV